MSKRMEIILGVAFAAFWIFAVATCMASRIAGHKGFNGDEVLLP